MAKFNVIFPTELVKEFGRVEKNSKKMVEEMTRAGAEVVVENIKSKITYSGRAKEEILEGLKLTRTYRTPSDDGINTKVYFSGYIPFKGNRKTFSRSNGKSKKIYTTTKGIPREFLVMVNEFGTSRISKKPFFRKSFKKKQIEEAMLKVQNKYLPKD